MNEYYLIRKFDIDSLAIEISDFTLTPLQRVVAKPFIGYLKGYLSHWGDNNSVVLENEYIDSCYLDDYSKYYAKNFKNYNKKCLRIHFFNLPVEDLKKIYKLSLSADEIQKFKDNYLGYVVIRPIVEYFVGKVCLKRWFEDDRHSFLPAPNFIYASLLGINFSINTIPFMEQDHVISVCATSALWSFFHASKYLSKETLRSPFAITNEALINNNCYDDNNLTPGYTVEMICDCIKNNGLVPLHFDVDVAERNVLKEYIHCFLESGYPVIMGLDVYNKKIEEDPYSHSFIENNTGRLKYDFQGLHAVTVLGDFYDKNGFAKFYIHDDMIGPYACLMETKFCWELDFDITASHSSPQHSSEYYVPTDIIVGIHSKIRLPYKNVRLFCKHLMEGLKKSLCDYKDDSDKFEYKIRVIESNSLKSDLRNKNDLYLNIDKLIKTPLPRFVWIADFYEDSNLCFSFVFDATEIPHGKSLLYILYTDEVFIKQLESLYNYYRSPVINEKQGNVYDMMDQNVYPFYIYWDDSKRIIENNNELLSELFGIAKSPLYIKDFEYDLDEIKDQHPFIFKSFEDVKKSGFRFDKKQDNYIWIIDEFGYLYIGIENKEDPKTPNKGHPTLIKGRKGRIGGELHYNRKLRTWEINSKSGRYSYILDDTDESNKVKYLENAMNERFMPYFKKIKFRIV